MGMYVAALDRPWEQTPFSIHGFFIRERTELKQLQAHCEYVFIDIEKDKRQVVDSCRSF